MGFLFKKAIERWGVVDVVMGRRKAACPEDVKITELAKQEVVTN
ncbi:MAG: hypothetical protein ACJATE_001428 [Bacteroidia bacterium]|jgi:hypothetical protein